MKKIFITILLVCCTFSVFSQTAEETKEYIKLKSKSFDLGYSSDNIGDKFYPKIINNYNFEFYDKYLIIERNNMFETAVANNWDISSTDYICIELKKIKSIIYEKDRNSKEWDSKGTIYINNDADEFPYVFNNQKKYMVTSFLSSKDKESLKYEKILPIRISVRKYDEQTFIKLKKAFKHLVELNGGKIIDDLF